MSLTAKFLDEKRHEVQRVSHFKLSIAGFSEDVSVHVRSASLPTKSHDVITTQYFNEVNKQAGFRSYGDLSIEIHDAVSLNVAKLFNDWTEQIQRSTTGTMGYAADYKRQAILSEYTINGQLRHQWRYEGVWPSSFSLGTMTRDNADKRSISVTLSVDKVYPV